MQYQIKRQGRRCAVVGDDGVVHGVYPTFEAAQERQRVLQMIEHARRERDPEVLKQRRDKAAYRDAKKPGTELHALSKIFPRKGAIAKRTEAHYRGLELFQGIDFAGIERGKQQRARHQAVTKASGANVERGAGTASRVANRWLTLTDIPERKRASLIAHELNIDVRHVRRLRPR